MTSVRVNSYRVGMLIATFVLVLITCGESPVFGQGGGIVLSALGDQISQTNVDVTGSRSIPSVATATVTIGFDLQGNPISPMEGTATESAQNLVNNLVSFINQPPPNLTKWNDLQGDTMMMPIHVTLNQPKTVKFYTITSANEEVLRKNPIAFQVFIRVQAELANEARQHPEKFVNVFTEKGPTAVTGDRLAIALEEARATPIQRAPTAADRQRVANVAKLFVEAKSIDRPLAVDDIVFDVDAAASAKLAEVSR